MKNIPTLLLLLCLCFVVSCGKAKKKPDGKDYVLDNISRVTLFFDLYNHTQGFLKSFEKRAFQGETLKLHIDQFDVNGVDERRIVVREGRMWRRVAYSRLGECELIAPKTDTYYTIYLMNESHGADYRVVDVRVGLYEGNLQFPRKMKWFIENRDGFEGPVEPLREAIQDLNEALDYPWASYGQFLQVRNKSEAHFFVGYGYCQDQYGWHTAKWAGVNPKHSLTKIFMLETFLEEVFELVTSTENIGEKDSVSIIADPKTGHLNAVGRDLFAYLFIKDVK